MATGESILTKQKLPSRDAHDLPLSGKRFDDGGQYRIEIPSCEGPAAMQAVISEAAVRQVPVNQWILGKRYGSYQKNPLTQWLRGRKDTQPALLLGNSQEPLTIAEIPEIWQDLTKDLLTPDGRAPSIEQAQQTWRVEMLMRGISLEDMQILTGLSIDLLTPYEHRAKEKAALEQAISLDRQRSSKI